jgi:hypothetical protein
MASDDLRRQADVFIELNDLADIIGRPARLPRVIQEAKATARAATAHVGQEADAQD